MYDPSEPLTAVYCQWLYFCLSSQNGSRSVPGSRSGSGRFLSLAGVPGCGKIILFTFCSMWIETAAAGSDTGCGFFCARHVSVIASDLAQAVLPSHQWRWFEGAGSQAGTRANALCSSSVASQSEQFQVCDRVGLGVPIAKQWRSEAAFYQQDVVLLVLPAQWSEDLLRGCLVTLVSLQRRSVRARLKRTVTPEDHTDAYVYWDMLCSMCKRNVACNFRLLCDC